jgi:hypothetical protein
VLTRCRARPLLHPVVLVILDRNVDLVPMLSHSWTYQALVHDVLDMKLNRVTVEVSSSLFLSSPLHPPLISLHRASFYPLYTSS